MTRGDVFDQDCPSRPVFAMLSAKWTPLVVWSLGSEVVRFSDLKRRVGGISQKMLTKTLRDLEAMGLLTRTVHAAVPPVVEYELTDLGRSLLPAIEGVIDWAETNYDRVNAWPQVANADRGPVPMQPATAEPDANPARPGSG